MARAPKPPQQPTALEGATGAVGLILVLTAIAILAWQGLKGGDAPPEIELRPTAVARSGDAWRLDIEVSNTGESTAQDVVVEGRFGDETSEVTLDYLPGDGRRAASLVFTTRPDPAAVELRVRGWVDP